MILWGLKRGPSKQSRRNGRTRILSLTLVIIDRGSCFTCLITATALSHHASWCAGNLTKHHHLSAIPWSVVSEKLQRTVHGDVIFEKAALWSPPLHAEPLFYPTRRSSVSGTPWSPCCPVPDGCPCVLVRRQARHIESDLSTMSHGAGKPVEAGGADHLVKVKHKEEMRCDALTA